MLMEPKMSMVLNDAEKNEPSRADDQGTQRWHADAAPTRRRPADRLPPPLNYIETLHLARKFVTCRHAHACLDNPDPSTAVVAANSILERASGKPREMKPEEVEKAHIDLTPLTNAELALLVKLVESDRLRDSRSCTR
jgi:hypothetical protein